MSVSIRDIARSLGLSHTTVSRVLNDSNAIKIPDGTRVRVRRAAEEMGYARNSSARALATGKTNLIALQVYRLDSAYSTMVAQQFQDVASSHGYEIIVRSHSRHNDLVLQTAVDGIVAFDTEHVPNNDRQYILNRPSVPYIAVGPSRPESMALDTVGIDLSATSKEATKHLISSGWKKIVHLTGCTSLSPDARFSAYSEVMCDAGLQPEFLKVDDELRIDGYEAAYDYFRLKKSPMALFCRNDELAVGAMRALHVLGYRIPDDVAIIGCDGICEGSFTSPTLSTIETPIAEMCDVAWTFLTARMLDHNSPTQTAILPSKLVIKESC